MLTRLVIRSYVYLYFPSSSQPGGVRIPYPLISLHAIQSSSPPSIYLQLQSSGRPDDHHDPDATLELTLIPAPPPHPTDAPSSPPAEPGPTPTQALYAALRDGAEMWPGLGDDEDEERPAIMFDVDGGGDGMEDGPGNGLPPPMPGSGGWITSDNVGEFFDEEGNWRGREFGAGPDGGNELGEGAGTVRPREDDDGEDEGQGINGEETKWRRTD
jgi:nucleotide-sensitive chloride channel 1A